MPSSCQGYPTLRSEPRRIFKGYKNIAPLEQEPLEQRCPLSCQGYPTLRSEPHRIFMGYSETWLVHSGFAAGCEARLCLAVTLEFENGLCPWFGLCPQRYGPKAEPGAQPKTFRNLDGEAEPRLTSGGEAAAEGIKFHDQSLFSKRYLTSGGEAAAEGSSFMMLTGLVGISCKPA
jgi:hypothetical protein